MIRFLPIIFVALTISVIAQNSEIDSLKRVLVKSYNPTDKANVSLLLARNYESVDIDQGKIYARRALLENNDSIMARACNQLGRLFFYSSQLDSAKIYFEKAIKLLTKIGNKKQVASLSNSLGAVQLRQGDYNKCIKTLTESSAYFEECGDEVIVAKCYNNMSAAFAELGKYPKAIEYNAFAIDIFNKYNMLSYQLIALPNLAAQYLKAGDTLKAIEYNLQAEELAMRVGNKRSLSIIYNNLGSVYLDIDAAKAKEYLLNAISLKNELNLKNGIEVAQGNLGYLHLKNKNYKTALDYYLEVKNQVNGEQLVYVLDQISKCYKGMHNYDKALQSAQNARILKDSLTDAENKKIFSEIQISYETEKREREILELERKNLEVDNKRIRNQNLLLSLLALFFFVTVFVYFFLKKTRRRQQQEQNKLLKRLKEQELQGLDKIIEAQENERQRIANDLHDNLGSRMATLKLLINDVHQQLPKQHHTKFKKLESLAEETYGEVRKIAHNNHTGVLISRGLIPSMKIIANQISESNNTSVYVININVEKRIKNNIEIQVFRILQELITNIIKHAKASEITIQFSEDKDELNVMIEDDGIGFDIKKINYGLGLTNIEKRLTSLAGKINIDTSPGNGTTIILTIPL
ncbi:tetratricopeptide repeat protein [uncultured Draconibacterium sp.]|uniref:tetratricopeptide repeat-containing sensor histidine kinase n=1 Tax=uncultured Draconibacterium sp. TaxID=1573823 RepID=UPI0029C8CDA9|nr:tetratricopeptide repeat protein [uncultured Draconibacterium sp.]